MKHDPVKAAVEPAEMRTDVLILGAGASGLAAAATLAESGQSVLLADTYDVPGGNHISREIDGRSYDIGAIFFRNDAPLFSMAPGLFDQCVPVKRRLERIAPDGRILAYPFEMSGDFFARSAWSKAKILMEMGIGRLTELRPGSLDAYFRRYIGATLRRTTGIDTYVKRFYGLHPAEVDAVFAASRMSWVRNNVSLRHRIKSRLKGKRAGGKAAQYVVRPEAGYPALYHSLLDALAPKGVTAQLGTKIDFVRKDADGFTTLIDGTQVRSKRLINTMPIEIFARLAGLSDIEAPRSRRLLTLFCTLDGDLGFDGDVLYNFHNEGSWKRITVASNFYGKSEGCVHFSAEITVDREATEDAALYFEAMRDHLQSLGLCTGDLRLAGHLSTDFAYPVLDPDAMAAKEKALARIAAMGVESAGRQGGFEYYPTAALAMRRTIKRIGG